MSLNPFQSISKWLSKSSKRESMDSSNTNGGFGLFRLYSRQISNENVVLASRLNSNTVVSNESMGQYNADIVAIHGLGGSAYKTWTHDNGRLWLRDFVLDELPGARIYTFGYDSGFAFSKGTGTLSDFARSLLAAIKLQRETSELNRRPLVFVCHSMGGIVAKLAVTIAKNESDHYPGIGKAVTAILFLGTPHQGSASARYATVLARTANALVTGMQVSRFTGSMRTDILKTLQRHEPELLRVAEDFRVHTADIKIISFVEGKKMQALNTRVVDDHSAFVGAPTEIKVPMPGYDHREMCRHGSSTDNGLRLILGAIKECLPSQPSETISVLPSPAQFIQIPFQRNEDFVGQEHILELLRVIFNENSGPRPREVALYGLGGIGKSQIALQYAYKVKEHNDTSIFWVFAGSRERFERDYLGIARGLKLLGHNDPETNILRLVKDSLQKPSCQKWLMIIDNADDISLFFGVPQWESHSDTSHSSFQTGIFNYIPDSANGSILYTTRSKANALQLTSNGRVIKVTEMNDENLKSLFQSKLDDETVEGEWIEMIEVLERLPLALVQAASYMRQNSWSMSKYLKYFRSKDTDISMQFLLHDFRDKTRDETVANSIFKTWIITVQQLEEEYPMAAEALWIMAFYNRQNIPRYLLLYPHTPPSFQSFNSASIGKRGDNQVINQASTKATNITPLVAEHSEFVLDRAIGTLVSYSFITITHPKEGENYTLHRLVQLFARYWLKEHRRSAEEWAKKSLASLVHYFPVEEYEDWVRSAELLPHIEGIVDYQLTTTNLTCDLGVLLIAASTYLRVNAKYPSADKYIRLAIATLGTTLGKDHPIAIDAQLCLSRCLLATSHYTEAQQLFQSIIINYAKVLGEDHPKTFWAKTHLSTVLRMQKKYTEAIEIAQESIRGLERLEGIEASRTLQSKMSLATILGDMGQCRKSLEIQQELADIMQRKYGSEHPQTLHILHDLAITLTKEKQLKEAKIISQRVVELNEKIYGLDHPRSMNILFNLAQVLAKQGNYVEAEERFRRVLSYYEKTRCCNNRDTINCMRSLALCLENQQSYAMALSYYQCGHERLLATLISLDADRFEIEEDITRVQNILDQNAITAEELEPQRKDKSIPSSATITTLVGGGSFSWDDWSSYPNPPEVC